MSIWSHPEFDDHEMVIQCADKASGLRAIVAIHDTTLGQAMGGCRMKSYASEADAMSDALRLSRGMSYKYAASGLNYGGAKAVIVDDGDAERRVDRLLAFGRFLERLGGIYITGEDAGIETSDVRVMAQTTRFIRNLPLEDSGDAALCTAWGVFYGIEAGLEAAGLPGIAGRTIAVEGLGKVGMGLCGLIDRSGGKLIVHDIDAGKVAQAAERFGAVVASGPIHAVEADVYSPCALGATLNPDSIPEIRASVVAGAANNQLSDPSQDAHLLARGITYCPDYVVNAGGVLSVPEAGKAFALDDSLRRVEGIGATIREVLDHARRRGIPTGEASDERARARLRG